MSDLFRNVVIMLSVVCSITAIVYARRTKKNRGFAIIAAVVPLEWVAFYTMKFSGLISPVELNSFSLIITAQSLIFLLGFLLYAMAEVG